MTHRSESPQVDKEFQEFTEQIVKARLGCKDASKCIQETQWKISSATASLHHAANRLEQTGEFAAANALNQIIISLMNERQFLEKILDIVGCE